MSARRILILTNRIPHPLNDGGNLAVHTMIEGYQKEGWEVFLLSMLTSRHPVPADQLKTLFTDLHKFETVSVNTDVKPLVTIANYLFSSKPNHAKRFYHRSYAKKLKEVLLSFKPDVVQMESLFLAPYIDIVKQNSKAVNVLRMHNIEYQVWERLAYEVRNPLKKMYLNNLAARIKKFEIASWKLFDLLLPITKDDAAIVKFLNHHAHMIITPFGIDTENIGRNENEQWIGYHIGAMDWMPNAEAMKWFISYVWPEVYRASPSFRFYFAGRNMPPAFEENLPIGISCAGEVEDANAFIADKKILIVPLRSGGGIRVKILEAMAAGKLVISTKVGMQGIEAVTGEHYLTANSARQFAEVIKKALTDREASERIAAKGRLLVNDKYKQTNIMKMVISGIEKLL